MKRKNCSNEWLLCAALLSGVGLGVVSGMALYAAAYPVFQSKEWASWVQAFGSIAAILGAVYAVRYGAKLNERLQSDRLNRGVLAVAEVFNQKIEEVAVALNDRDDPAWLSLINIYSPALFDSYLRAFQEVRVLDLPSPKAVTSMLEAQRLARFYLDFLDEAYEGPWKTRSNEMSEELEKLQAMAEEARSSLIGTPGGEDEIRSANARLEDTLAQITNNQKRNVRDIGRLLQGHIATLCEELRSTSQVGL